MAVPPATSGERDSGEASEEPDYRFTLANERTFLAWIRTALAMLAGAIAVVQLVPTFGFSGARTVVGMLLAFMGIGIAIGSLRHWQVVQEAMRRGAELPRSRMPILVAGGLALLSVFVVVLILLRKNG